MRFTVLDKGIMVARNLLLREVKMRPGRSSQNSLEGRIILVLRDSTWNTYKEFRI
jgi:hypothetical protein